MTHGEPHGVAADHDRLGRFTRGNNARVAKQRKIAAKFEALRHEYFPNGGENIMDSSRLVLAAKHFVTAETHRDTIIAQRSVRLAELLLSKIKRPAKPALSLAEALAAAR
jgi:hypothetical protein